MDKEQRLKELRTADQLSDEEMRELIGLANPGELISLPGPDSIGLVNFDKAFKNLGEIMERADRAESLGFFVEAISLRLQHTEFWLRMFWVAKNPESKIFEPGDKSTFGNLIERCAKLNFKPALTHELRRFNKHRIDAIHKLLLGATDYDQLCEVCQKYRDLPRRVGQHVRGLVGIPLKQ